MTQVATQSFSDSRQSRLPGDGISLGLGMTNECNLDCAFCYRDPTRADRLSLDQVRAVMESLPVRSVNLGTLLKVDVFEKVTANGSRRNRIPEHLDAGKMRNRTFHWHQALAQVLIDTRNGVCIRHRTIRDRENAGSRVPITS